MEKSEELQENDGLVVRQKVSTKMTVATRRQTVYQYSSSNVLKLSKQDLANGSMGAIPWTSKNCLSQR